MNSFFGTVCKDLRLNFWNSIFLMSIDRLHSDDIVITQEMISKLLGVRRESVTQAVGQLQKDGLIAAKRGHIQVLDKPAMEARVCECYEVVRKEYERLLPTVPDVDLSDSM
jgi:DNA-binding IscR family transcriptional regulator